MGPRCGKCSFTARTRHDYRTGTYHLKKATSLFDSRLKFRPMQLETTMFSFQTFCGSETGSDWCKVELRKNAFDVITRSNAAMTTRYQMMLAKAQERGIVKSWKNLVEAYMSTPETAQARSLPYLEGDYWVDKAETIIAVGRECVVLVVFYRHMFLFSMSIGSGSRSLGAKVSCQRFSSSHVQPTHRGEYHHCSSQVWKYSEMARRTFLSAQFCAYVPVYLSALLFPASKVQNLSLRQSKALR